MHPKSLQNSIRKVLIVDDHNVFASGLRSMLNNMEHVTVSCIVKSGHCVLPALAKKQPDVLFLDVELPAFSGLELLPKIRKQFPKLIICMLTMHDKKQIIQQARKGKANAFLNKDASSIELHNVIFSSADDPFYVSKTITQRQAAIVVEKHRFHAPVRFSKRELQIIGFMVKGKSNTQMSKLLFVSPETIKSHRKNIFCKLKIHSSAELVKYAVENQML